MVIPPEQEGILVNFDESQSPNSNHRTAYNDSGTKFILSWSLGI